MRDERDGSFSGRASKKGSHGPCDLVAHLHSSTRIVTGRLAPALTELESESAWLGSLSSAIRKNHDELRDDLTLD